ncbi:hypothetical protein ADK34_17635 [Streptomyces viridochromogenes]|uniref:Uncharacterized protein n=1 Tax=Streptomyces viridochromogenes TaxID=1938 RepID=A0A0L8KIB8_STRVR|nr:hypothetical protein ADK34_17635 [Streptomyces viridochromogenes]
MRAHEGAFTDRESDFSTLCIADHGYRPPQVFIDAVLAVGLDVWVARRWPDVPFPRASDDAERMPD